MSIQTILENQVCALELETAQSCSESEQLRSLFLRDGRVDGASLRLKTLLSILDSMPAMIGYWDRNLHNRFSNRAYSTWFGVSPVKLLGKHIRELLGEQIYQLNLPYIEAVLQGVPQKFERTIPVPDGTGVRYSLAEYIPDIVDDNVVGFFVQVSDITAIKLAEKGLRENAHSLQQSEARYRSIVQEQTEIVSRLRVDGSYIFANETFLKFFGKSSAELLNSGWHPIVYQDDLLRVNAEISKLSLENPVVMIENRVYSSDGQVHWMQFSNRGLFDADGQLVEIQSVGRDISDRKQIEMNLRESEARFQVMTANVPGMVFQCTQREAGFNFTYISNGAEWLLGVSATVIEHDANEFLARILPEYVDAFNQSLTHSHREMTLWNWEGRVLSADNGIKWINLRATPRMLAGGGCIWDGVAVNVTESKGIEEKLLHSQQMLRELSAHLENIREDEHRHIAREIHDELGQALTALRMDVSLVRLNFGEANPELLTHLQSMSQRVQRTVDIVRHITSSLRPGALDMGIVAALEWLAEEFTGYTQIQCELALNDGNIALDEFSATAVFRIVQESLTNIARHAQATQVEVIVTRSEDELCFEVCDNGTGFDPGAIENCKSFGLIGIRERVAMLSGHFEIESRQGAGTCLRVHIPVA